MTLAAPTNEPASAIAAEILEDRQVGSGHKPCTKTHIVKKGEYCYLIATNNKMTLKQFMSKNQGLNCDKLWVGDKVCI